MEEEAPPAAGAAAAVAVAAAAGEAQMAEADAAPAVPEAAAAAAAATGAPPAGSAQRTGGLQQPLLEMAGCRWLDGDAAYAGLTAPKDAGLSLCKEPQLQPQAGSLLLFDQDRCPEYRRDGYEWRKGKVKYTLKVNGVDTVSCFYDKPEDQRPDALQRRRYVLRDPGQGPRQVLVQYRLPDPGAERRRRGPAARVPAAAAGEALAAAGEGGDAAGGEAEGEASAAPAAKRRRPAAAAPSRQAGAAPRQQQQQRRRRPDFAPPPGVLEDCYAAVVGLLEQAGVPDDTQQAVGDAFERLDSSGLEHFIWWTHLDECVALDGGESAVQAFAQMVADQPEPVAAAG